MTQGHHDLRLFFFLPRLEVNDLGPGSVGDLLQFLLSDVLGVDFQVSAAHTDDPESGLFFPFFDLAPFAHKNFACHDTLLSPIKG